MGDRIRFLWNRLREKLWVRPIGAVLFSITGAFLAKTADRLGLEGFVPDISVESIDSLLTIMASSMLVIATFSVASMVSAYASASNTATPRSFAVIIADDVSQNALSMFIGAFIFSIVSLIALENEYYDVTGRFALFALTLFVFALVITTFIRWVDRVARLGRLGETVDRLEAAAAQALKRRRLAPHMRGKPVSANTPEGRPVPARRVGYVQRVDVEALQACAAAHELTVTVERLPGAFVSNDTPLVRFRFEAAAPGDDVEQAMRNAFVIGDDRLFDEDPRFGLVVLSEVAVRALSPAVNDPGTAIDIIGTLVRLFTQWAEPVSADEHLEVAYDRVEVPSLDADDLIDDAFTAIARDGAGQVEVVIRLQKAFNAIGRLPDPQLAELAAAHARRALARSDQAMSLAHDRQRVHDASELIESDNTR